MSIDKFLKFSIVNLGFHKINPTDYIPKIEKEIEMGLSKSTIFEKLSFDVEAKDELAFLINSVASNQQKRHFKTKNTLILVLISIYFLFTTTAMLFEPFSLSSLFWFLFQIFVLVQLKSYKARAYFFVIVYSVLNLIFLLIETQGMKLDIEFFIMIIIFIIFFLTLITLASNIKNKLYPNYTFIGPRVDENDKYVFSP